jgi:hypothetical protein
MRNKTDRMYGIRLTAKSRLYLERLGLLDGRNGRIKDEGDKTLSFSDFVNKCIIIVCESNMHPGHDHASNEELKTAWIKFQARLLNAEIIKCEDELIKLANQSTARKELLDAEDLINKL